MHELTLALSALDIINDTAKEHHLETVDQVIIEKGMLSGVLDDAFVSAFAIISKGTCAEHASLKIMLAPAMAWCKRCNQEFAMTHFDKICPTCDSTEDVEFNPSQFYVKSIEGNQYEN